MAENKKNCSNWIKVSAVSTIGLAVRSAESEHSAKRRQVDPTLELLIRGQVETQVTWVPLVQLAPPARLALTAHLALLALLAHQAQPAPKAILDLKEK
nr:hypothetical protein BaRGS_000073 [Batillaria attramentaria]